MPTYGQRPDDVVADSRGNALKGVLLKLYATEALAVAGGTPLGTATSTDDGTWEFVTDELDLYARLPNGKVWQVAQSVEAMVSAAESAAADAAASKDLAQDALNSAQAAQSAAEAVGSTKENKQSTYTAVGGDETTALNNFLAAASPLGVKRLIGSFSVSGLLTVPANANVDAYGATITQTASLTSTMLVNSGVRVAGLSIVGKGTDYVNTSSVYGAVGFALASGATDVTIERCTVTNMAGAGVYASTAPTRLRVTGCTFTGMGSGTVVAGGQWSGGITINNDGASDVLVANTSISGFAQGIVTGNITDLRVTGCFIKDIAGQHGIYVASASRYAIVGNVIDNANLEGIKVQIGTTSSPDAVDGVISGNVVSRCGSHSIHLVNTAGGAPRHRRVAITGNTVTTDTGATGDGINVDYADDVTIVGNRVSGGRNGILIASANAVTVSTNRASACTDRGIGIVNVTDFDVLNNRVKDVATANNAATEFGIHLDGATTADGRVNGNKVTESPAGTNMRYALYLGTVTAANQATMTFVDNVLTGATDYGARMVSAATTLRFHGNVLGGTTGPILTPPTNYAANADTSGATLTALETEVNELKAALRAVGVLAP